MHPRARRWLRYALTLVTAGVVLYFFWPLVGELRSAARLFQNAGWGWLGLALLLQAAGNTSLTALNYWLLRPFPGQTSFLRVLAVLPAIAFIEVAVPSAGASGVVLRARLLGQSGHSVEASVFTLALEGFYEFAVRAAILTIGVGYLLGQGELGAAQLGYLAGLVGLMVLIVVAAWRLSRDQARAERWLLALTQAWNRVAARLGLQPYAPAAVSARLQSFYRSLERLRRVPSAVFWATAAGHIGLDLAAMGVCFLAFGHALPAGTLLTGYSLSLLVSGLAVLPGALALTEASLAVLFSRLGVPGDVAIAAALTYRLTAFWMLRFVGFITWQILEVQHEKRRANWPTL